MHAPLYGVSVKGKLANEKLVISHHEPHVVLLYMPPVSRQGMEFNVRVLKVQVNWNLAEVAIEIAEGRRTFVNPVTARGLVSSYCSAAEGSAIVLPSGNITSFFYASFYRTRLNYLQLNRVVYVNPSKL